MKLSHAWSRASAEFDESNIVSLAGLVPVMELAERAGLSELIAAKVDLGSTRVASAGANPAGKLTAILAGMVAGADCIEDLDLLRTGGMGKVFGEVYAPATLGQFLREFTHGHVSQLASVARAHLVELVALVPDLLPDIGTRALIDVDSLLRPVYGHAKQGASFGHTKISGRQVLRRGLSPLVVTIATEHGAPLVAGIRLRSGKANSGKGAASMVREAIATARALGASGEILVRGDCAYGVYDTIAACRSAGARFSFVLTRNPAVDRAIASIADDAWIPVDYPGAEIDPDTGALVSDAEVAEIEYTAFTSRRKGEQVTARLIVRRVRDRATPSRRGEHGELFPVWRHHPFFTDSTDDLAAADATHRRHAIVETVFADLIDGPLAHMPSGRFATNAAWSICAGIEHNLLRAAGTLARGAHAAARGATLRRRIVNVPARPARPARRAVLHLPNGWPWAEAWKTLWDRVFALEATGPPAFARP